MILKFSINKNKLFLKNDEIITSFSKNINKCIFECEKPLDDIYKYALFSDPFGNQEIIDLGLGLKTECVIPEKILESNYFYVSVFGGDLFTTTQQRIIVNRSGLSQKSIDILESGNINDSYNSGIDSEDLLFFWEDMKTWKRSKFEMQEHPYI